jgi:hypothetical protein
VRFQLAHKLVTYMLVLSAVAALAATRALSSSTALLFLVACAASFGVDPGNRLAAAFDRATLGLRLGAVVLFAALLWRIWRHLPDPDYGPGFDLGLALLGYKLFYRRTHRDYIHILAFSFLLVLVASTLAASFAFVVAFAVYVTFAVWGLILFHLRREMEENYLVKHSAQAPSQKVGVGRILGSRRVVGASFFLATGGVALAVLAGAIAIFMFVPRMGAGFVLGGAATPGGTVALGDEIALGRYGTRAAARRDVVLRATIPAISSLGPEAVRRSAADGLYFRGATYDLYEHGHWAHSRKPEVATLVSEDGDARTRRFWVSEPGEGDAAALRAAGADADAAVNLDVRQEIEAVGLPAAVLFAIDRAVALELRRKRGRVPHARAGALRRLLERPPRGRDVGRRRSALVPAAGPSDDGSLRAESVGDARDRRLGGAAGALPRGPQRLRRAPSRGRAAVGRARPEHLGRVARDQYGRGRQDHDGGRLAARRAPVRGPPTGGAGRRGSS